MVQARKSRPAAKKTAARKKAPIKATLKTAPKVITGIAAVDKKLLAILDRVADVLGEVNNMVLRSHTSDHGRTQLLSLSPLQLSKAETLLAKLRGEWVRRAPPAMRGSADRILDKLETQLKRLPRAPKPKPPRARRPKTAA